MDIFITGASGLIGLPTVQRLSRAHTVYALARTIPAEPTGTNVCWLQGDLTHAWPLVGLPEHVDVVIHLAQSQHFREFPAAASDIFTVNVASTVHLLDYARQVGARQFIYTSSGGVYGSGPYPFSESHALPESACLNFYLVTKCCAEALVRQYAAFFITTILRPFFVYGVAQQPDMLMPRLISNVRTGRSITLAGSEGMRLNPIYNLDCVEVLERCLTLQESQTLNIAGSEILTLRQIGEMIGEVVGRQAHFIVTPESASDLVGDTSQLMELLGYQPRVSFRTGIARVCHAVHTRL
jgi:UDP-glucose 4-epimerase